MRKLIPRLNYDFGGKSILGGFLGIVDSSKNISVLEKFFETENIYLTNHARTGLRLLLNSIGLQEGDKIGVQVYNCNSVFNAIKNAGFIPVFIDIGKNLAIDIEDLKAKVKQINALVITHTFGIPVDVSKIREIVGNIPIIEDCAHSFLSCIDNNITGKSGDAAIFSIGNAKFPSFGEGGIVLINNNDILINFVPKYQSLLKYSLLQEIFSFCKHVLFYLAHRSWIYGSITAPFLKKIDQKKDFGGKFKFEEYKILKSSRNILLSRLYETPKFLLKQRKNAEEILKSIPAQFKVNRDNETKGCNYFMIPILVESPTEMIRIFDEFGVEIGSHFSKSIVWASSFGYIIGTCPNTEKIVQQLIVVPCHYKLKNSEIAKIRTAFLNLEL